MRERGGRQKGERDKGREEEKEREREGEKGGGIVAISVDFSIFTFPRFDEWSTTFALYHRWSTVYLAEQSSPD